MSKELNDALARASWQRWHHCVQSLDDDRPPGLRTFLGRTHDDLLLAAHPAKVRRFKIVALLIESISLPPLSSVSSPLRFEGPDSGPAPLDLTPIK
jgi:hypothetical protein